MTNAELIYSLRYCFEKRKTVVGVPWYVWCDRAADALEAAEKRIARLEEDLKTREAEREVMQDTIKICEEAADRYKAQIPKEGEWIGVNPMVDTEQCSICGWNIPTDEFETNYCPNCGAKMRGEHDADN